MRQPPPFEAHWLAEAIRLHEARHGRLADEALLPGLHAAPPDFERRALARAQALAAQLGWSERVEAWRRHARLSMLLLVALASSAGAGLAFAVLGEAGRPVNLLWALLGLLGMHLVSLALWAGTFAARDGASLLGRLWLGLARQVPRAREVPELGQALARLLASRGLGRWLFGAVSHGLWSVLLASATLSLVTLFALRRYDFVWETTILEPAALQAAITALDALPALAGFAAPAGDTLAGAGGGERAAWARWLIACLLLYGLLPRCALWLWCRARWASAGRALRIDLALPDNLLLRERLMPDRHALGVADPAPEPRPGARTPQPVIDGAAGAALVGVELGEDLAWPPPLARPLKLLERVDDREQRRRLIARLRADPPRRLLVAFDARLSPDRGSFALLAELAACAGRTAAWLRHPPAAPPVARLRHWREGLLAAGIGSELIVSDADMARLWLEADDG